ncbi:hypothetical protein OG937_10390 [Streptomyces sp. NBC_00510]
MALLRAPAQFLPQLPAENVKSQRKNRFAELSGAELARLAQAIDPSAYAAG